jgi:hypothetical protein
VDRRSLTVPPGLGPDHARPGFRTG